MVKHRKQLPCVTYLKSMTYALIGLSTSNSDRDWKGNSFDEPKRATQYSRLLDDRFTVLNLKEKEENVDFNFSMS